MSDEFSTVQQGGANAADPEYAGWDDTVPQAKVSGQVVDAFPFYIVRPFTAKLRDLKEGTTPNGRVGVLIVEGPGASADQRVFADLYLGVSTDKPGKEIGPNGRPIKEPKTAKELAKSTTYFQHSLNRLAFALGLTIKRPAAKTEAAFEAYLSQFDGDDRPLMIVEIQVEAKEGQTPRNRIDWTSARGINEPAGDSKLAVQGMTALQEARQRIAERNANDAKKSGRPVAVVPKVGASAGNGAAPSLD